MKNVLGNPLLLLFYDKSMLKHL